MKKVLSFIYYTLLAFSMLMSITFFIPINQDTHPVWWGLRFVFGGFGLFVWLVTLMLVSMADTGGKAKSQ